MIWSRSRTLCPSSYYDPTILDVDGSLCAHPSGDAVPRSTSSPASRDVGELGGMRRAGHSCGRVRLLLGVCDQHGPTNATRTSARIFRRLLPGSTQHVWQLSEQGWLSSLYCELTGTYVCTPQVYSTKTWKLEEGIRAQYAVVGQGVLMSYWQPPKSSRKSARARGKAWEWEWQRRG